MASQQHLISFHVIERGNNSNLIVWTYPTIDESLKTYLLRKAFLFNETCFTFYRRLGNWIYMQQIVDPNTATSALSGTAVVVVAKELNPEKYRVFCEVLSKTNIKSKDPVALVQLYLDTYIMGSCRYQENGTSFVQDIKGVERKCRVKGFIQKFGLEVILIYTALLLKKRILVYHTNISRLQKDILAILDLVSVRNSENVLFPFVENFREIDTHSFFVAGITDSNLGKKTDKYDIMINLPAQKITLSPHAKGYFAMTKIHKDLATFMVDISEKEASEKEVAAEITKKTKELLKHLYSLTSIVDNDRKMITMEDLKNRNLNKATENFLFNLAVAENIMML